MRGDLVSRPLGKCWRKPSGCYRPGVRELLVVSQDTSAHGVDVRYRTGFWQGRPLRTRMTELATRSTRWRVRTALWVRLHYVYPYPHVDEVIERMTGDPAAGGLLPYLDVPFQHASPRILKLMKRPRNAEGTLRRIEAWRNARPDLVIRSTFIAGFPGETEANSRSSCLSWRRRSSTASGALRIRRSKARRERAARSGAAELRKSGARGSWRCRKRSAPGARTAASARR
jgi:ribosomal protein S12 methylthiotransferase